MTTFFEQFLARGWNRFARRRNKTHPGSALELGWDVVDGERLPQLRTIPAAKRTEHIAVLGKTGVGKSSLLRHMASQDIRAGRGFVAFDLHGDTTPALITLIAAEEQRRGEDLSDRLIVVEPGDREFSVGLNILGSTRDELSFPQIGEFTEILKRRWNLDSFGARTEELLRNSLYLLAANGLTLVEIGPLLTNSAFRAFCLKNLDNSEIEAYFRSRFDSASPSMQAVLRDPILNKVTAFTADPRLRHIVGQRRSTISLPEAIEKGRWVLVNLDKGRLGDQAATLGSLFLTKIKNALFAREGRSLFTLYLDELQNFVAYDSGLDTLLSEARKFGVSVCSANQFLDQYPPPMRAAILAVGTHIFFQLASADAEKVSTALDGGRSLSTLLKNLPRRRIVIKSGHHRWVQAEVPKLDEREDSSGADLYRRSQKRWARPRSTIESEIRQRNDEWNRSHNEALYDWE